ncbi:MAG TPA: DUF192 domain-containing protein [Steroidobacteraceae bacterium]|nr:DUF192 domain-containing protein [Steroidobacteraceae bacterium]
MRLTLNRPDRLRRWCLALAAAMAAAGSTPALAQNGPLEDLAAFPRGKLEISDGKKVKLTFDVWLADSPSRQAQGLMFVRALPDLRGMLFVHESPKPISMWMKNTYIPLDMLFIDSRGRIQQIVEQATPHSLDIIRSNEPAVAVLEIAGGEARRLGLHPGQHVAHPALAKR